MILLTGGSGRLGSVLRGLIDCHAPTRQEFDITAPQWTFEPSLIVHCAAYTDVSRAQLPNEVDRNRCYKTNVNGTMNMAKRGVPLVYISTEYVFSGRMRAGYKESNKPSPVNYYATTKALGEAKARYAPRSLVIRCLFKERPYRHAMAPTDQYTTGDYVDVIAPMIAQCVKWFEAGHFGQHDTIHVGTARKSTYELAKKTRDVEPCTLAQIGMPLPADTSLDCSRYWRMAQEMAHGY